MKPKLAFNPTKHLSGDIDKTVKELNKIYDQNGSLVPSEVVDYAKNPKAYIHRYFTWDDQKAAHNYRLVEARDLVQCVTVVVHEETETTPAIHSRVFVSAKDTEGKRAYYKRPDIKKDPVLMASALRDAWNALSSARIRYADIAQLADVWAAIDQKAKSIHDDLEDIAS